MKNRLSYLIGSFKIQYYTLMYVCDFWYNRLQSINENIKIKQEPRRRSNSLPIPKIEVSFHHEPDFRGRIVKSNYSNIFDAGDHSPGMYIKKYVVIKYIFVNSSTH